MSRPGPSPTLCPVSTPADYHLVPFGPDAAAPARDLAELHATLLPASPVAQLGRRFMEEFYYHRLPRLGLIFGAVAYVGAHRAGFVAATHDSAGFMRAGMRQAWFQLGRVLTTTLLTNPGAARPLAAAWTAMRRRAGSGSSSVPGEILSLGVLPEYRQALFVRRSGLQISTDLIEHAITRLRARGVRAVRAVVAAENLPAKLLYCGLGWTLGRANVAEWSNATVEFIWRE